MSRLNDLQALLDSSVAKISGHRNEVNRLMAEVSSWQSESTRLYNRWQAIADNVFNRSKRAEAEAAYNHAVSRVNAYTNALNSERQRLADEEIIKEQILDDIEAFNMAVNIGIGSGFGEEGSVQVAEAQIALQEQQARNLVEDSESAKKRRQLWMVVIIGGSLVVAAAIFFMVRKARSKK